MMGVMIIETTQHDGSSISTIIPILVTEVYQMRALGDVDAIVGQLKPCG